MRKFQEFRQKISDYEEVHDALQVVEKTTIIKLQSLRNKASVLKELSNELKGVLERLSNYYFDGSNPLFEIKKQGKRALFIVAGNKGITGGLYNMLAAKTVFKRENYDLFFTSSKKLQRYLRRENIEAELIFSDLCETDSAGVINDASTWCIKNFMKDFSNLDFIYQQYTWLSEQKTVVNSFLPLDFRFAKKEQEKKPLGFPVFEPSKRQIFSAMIKRFIKTSFYSMVLQASLSEVAARTLNAHSAVSKTDELIDKIRLDFLKARRQIVTQRQLESFIVRDRMQ